MSGVECELNLLQGELNALRCLTPHLQSICAQLRMEDQLIDELHHKEECTKEQILIIKVPRKPCMLKIAQPGLEMN